MTREQAYKKIRKLVTAYANAQEDYSWRGGGDPANIPKIEKTWQRIKKDFPKKLKEILDSLADGG